MSLTLKLIYHKRVLKFLEKQEAVVQGRIVTAFKKLSVRPPIGGDIKSLKGQGNLMRLRVVTYRIIFEVNIGEEIVWGFPFS